MIKNILVPVSGSPSDICAIKTAFLAARLFGGHVTGFHVRPRVTELIPAPALPGAGTPIGNGRLIRTPEEESAEQAARARQVFDDMCEREQPARMGCARHAMSAEWREKEGDFVNVTIAEARYNDLVVMCRSEPSNGSTVLDIGAILVSCGRPLLLAPNTAPGDLGAHAVVAWKETAAAARAVSVAMPFLEKADAISIIMAKENGENPALCIASTDRLVRHLRRQQLPVEGNCVVPGRRSISATVLDTARKCGAGLLVMGGYGHGRTRGTIFGGFTNDILKDCDLPVLMFH